MLKRGFNRVGQVTVFIVIALILIGAIITTLVFRNKINILEVQSNNLNFEFKQIDSAIEDCVRQRAIDAVRIVGLQGGYVNLPKDYLVTNISNIAYGYYNGKNTLPTLEIIEKEISGYIEETIPYCLNLGDLLNYNITFGKSYATTKIKGDFVSVTGNLPISITKEEKSLTADRKYSSEISINLKNIHIVAEDTINKIIEDPEYIPIGYLAEKDFFIIVLLVDEKRTIYGITQNKTETNIDGVPYTFLFASKKK